MPSFKKNKRLTVISVLAAAAAVFAAFIFWLYSGPLTPPKIAVFRVVPLPMALVNFQPLPMGNFLTRFSAAQKVLGQPQAEQDKFKIVDRLIWELELRQMASGRDIFISQKQIDQAYADAGETVDLKGSANFQNYLASQGLSPDAFKEDALRPAILLSQLHVWFNSQQNLNPQAYQLADSLIGEINSGTDMAVLAGEYTQDPAGKEASGDMGFVQITDLSPELRETAGGMKVGEAKIIPGAAGLYIFRDEGQIGNQIHLRDILLQTSDFNAWLDNQIKNFKVINLLKI